MALPALTKAQVSQLFVLTVTPTTIQAPSITSFKPQMVTVMRLMSLLLRSPKELDRWALRCAVIRKSMLMIQRMRIWERRGCKMRQSAKLLLVKICHSSTTTSEIFHDFDIWTRGLKISKIQKDFTQRKMLVKNILKEKNIQRLFYHNSVMINLT